MAVLAVGLTLAYLPVYLPWLLRQVGVDLGWGPAGVLVWNWLAVALLALHVWRVERLDAASLGLVLATAVTEEVLWRGYVVERLGAWTGPLVAAGVGLAIFTATHLPFFGAGWLVSVLPGAVLLYVLLLWRRNLWACMLCHLIGNLPIFLVALLA